MNCKRLRPFRFAITGHYLLATKNVARRTIIHYWATQSHKQFYVEKIGKICELEISEDKNVKFMKLVKCGSSAALLGNCLNRNSPPPRFTLRYACPHA